MAQVAAAYGVGAAPLRRAGSAARFATAALALAVASAFLAGWAPLGFSIATVFLFAGPHNWLEFRYFLARMPARWGPLRGFFTLAIAGVLLLAAWFVAMPGAALLLGWDGAAWRNASAAWLTALLLWVAALADLRGRERAGRDWWWVWAAALLGAGAVWMVPAPWEYVLVYLHPLVALAFLQRVLRRRRPQWLPAYYACAAAVPLLVAALWLRLGHAPDLPGKDALALRITQHAGAGVVGLSSHFLVASHTFLEMLHYGVWVAAIPLLAMGTPPWSLQRVPLAHRGAPWRLGVALFLGAGFLAVLALWACFAANYPVTRDLYFTVAMVHVLAEFPFLLRAV